jgi:P-type Cu+ transporter
MLLEEQLCVFRSVLSICRDKFLSQCRLDRIVEVVREGQTRRAPIERVADLLISYFVPVVTLLAIVTWVVWLSLGLSGSLPKDYLDISIGGWRKSDFCTRHFL